MAFDGMVRVVKDEDLAGDGAGHSSPRYALGVKHVKNGNEYVYVYNGASDSKIGSGKYCVLQQSTGSSTSGYTVTVTNASLAGWMVGVAQNSIATGYYGFVMTKGVSVIALDSGEVQIAAHADIALGTDGGFVAAGATFSTAPRFGYTINSCITAATGKARIFGGLV